MAVSGIARTDLPGAGEKLGFPLVLKGEGVAHKPEAGAVAIGIAAAAALIAAAHAMPAARFLIEQMVTEIMQDSTHLILPVSADAVDRALDRLRIAPMLAGYRGAPPADRGAIIQAILAVQDYVLQEAPFEAEINPLICGTKGAIAGDALITTGVPE